VVTFLTGFYTPESQKPIYGINLWMI
jgi:hypothetical protein